MKGLVSTIYVRPHRGGLVLPVHVAKELECILFEYGVCDAWMSIEVDEIEIATKHVFHELDPGLFSALDVRQAQVDHLVDTFWMQQGQSPNDHCAPIMTDEGGIFVSLVIKKCDEITRQVFNAIVCHFGRTG